MHNTALVCGLFLAVAPARAQSITPQTYINGLYNWWKQSSTTAIWAKITVRATFLGGSAQPDASLTTGIFQGTIVGSGSDFGAFTQITYSPAARGTGVFYKIAEDLSATPPIGAYSTPFYIYYVSGGPLGSRIALVIDCSAMSSNANAKSLTFYLDQLTSNKAWPYGEWIGLNNGVGSAIGQVTMACSVSRVQRPN